MTLPGLLSGKGSAYPLPLSNVLPGEGGAPPIEARRPNPYVGPRSYRVGESLYARTRELAELRNLLIAERLVLLYARSGAGKTSLIQAALVPALQKKRFRVRPVLRVSAVPPGGVPPGANRYTLSVLLALEEDRPSAEQVPLPALIGLDLATYLDHRAVQDGVADEVLIFDQFEEVLTLDPTDQPAKVAFFAGLGDALRDRHRWALFALREDYLAWLDPYRDRLPGGLATTFRLDLLSPDPACQAIQGPARAAGVDFTDAAAAKLVDDLRRVQVQLPDGSTTKRLGGYVEPVQLQVICHRLWESLAADAGVITVEDIIGTGDVDSALGSYYASSVTAVAAITSVPELRIRKWCERQLIAIGDIRAQVLQTPVTSAGLDNRAIHALVDHYIVRAEQQRGATWFELAHDRLIQPIHDNNAVWLQPLPRSKIFIVIAAWSVLNIITVVVLLSAWAPIPGGFWTAMDALGVVFYFWLISAAIQVVLGLSLIVRMVWKVPILLKNGDRGLIFAMILASLLLTFWPIFGELITIPIFMILATLLLTPIFGELIKIPILLFTLSRVNRLRYRKYNQNSFGR